MPEVPDVWLVVPTYEEAENIQALVLAARENLPASRRVLVVDDNSPDGTGDIAERLATHGVAANRVQLEITEGALMADPRRVLATLQRLDRLGVALSLDDFGTGYSSLQHLRRLPLSEVKIDRSFVLGMNDDPDDAAIVRSSSIWPGRWG